ncbi:MAG: 2-C-methyl-D-erythritol 4-phosphate cytidylyltransferase [Candidatus Eisenbacteria bacterium]|nr:2-C-methyl-D-erythritol 4-phosphate cytidylyltransferase [Candidatus Eisenbacteria bacterium]
MIVIVPAAGAGLRLGGAVPKPYRAVEGRAILARTLEAVASAPSVGGIVAAVAPGETERAASLAPPALAWFRAVEGGEERFDSVHRGLLEVPEETEIVAVHDGVRPFVTAREIEETVALARTIGAAATMSAPVETVKRVDGDEVTATLDRAKIRLAQTPQAFRAELLREAYRRAIEEGWKGTDESALVERIGARVGIVQADRWNIKITVEEDLLLAEWIAREVRG